MMIRFPAIVASMMVSLMLAGAAMAQANEGADMTAIRIILDDGQTLPATLDGSRAGRDFASMLPLALSLSDYHGIEKVADLPRKVDDSEAPASYEPKAGDLTSYAPWGNLAIFYKPFQSSRGLVRLGEFDGPIDALLEDGAVAIRIERAD